MNCMEEMLQQKKSQGRRILVGYYPLCDPAMGNQIDRVGEFMEDGVDVLELGLPFENPVLDGPIVRESMLRALRDCDTHRALASIADIHEAYPEACLQVMTYFEVVEAMGIADFCAGIAEVGAAGVLSPNVPPAHEGEFIEELTARDLLYLNFAPYTMNDELLRRIARTSRGYIFMQAQDGATGPQDTVSPRIADNLKALRDAGARALLCAGFGISHPAQVRELVGMGVDGVIVGSSIIQSVLDGRSREYVSSLREALG